MQKWGAKPKPARETKVWKTIPISTKVRNNKSRYTIPPRKNR